MIDTWCELSTEMRYHWLSDALKTSNVFITFEKKDGSERKMLATLKSGVIPAYEKKTDREKKVNESVLSVFDLEKEEWRSFRLDSIREINFNYENDCC